MIRVRALVASALVLTLGLMGLWVLIDRWQTAIFQSLEGISAPDPVGAPVFGPLDSAVLPPLAAYDSLLERPLFNAARRTPVLEEESPSTEPPTVTAPEDPLPELDDLELVSVLIAPAGRQAWFLEGTADGTLLRLSEGRVFRKWTLDEVEASYAVFRARESEFRLDLRPSAGELHGLNVPAGGRSPRARQW